ncbi:unnamed protein product [Schistosoma margrebowiei]|uniref:Egg protein CP391S-like protein n=1 Tax=Schistosoma margrebowiei TaxID=48269 RepID=A0AA84ZU50_9TREM|nr:unnamed protein product [Schistosoma margrebowiei]
MMSNQPIPVVNDKFVRLANGEEITPKLPFKFYGTNVRALKMRIYENTVVIEMKAEEEIGIISTYLKEGALSALEISNKNVTLKVLYLIRPNGKISFYYENVPEEVGINETSSSVYGRFPCEVEAPIYPIITVIGERIKTGILVEYEVSGDCPNHNSSEACKGAKTSNTMCMWCEHANMCITSNDKDTQKFKVNGCRNKNSAIIGVSSETTLIEEKETTSTVNEADLRSELWQTTENFETHLTIPNVKVSSKPTTVEQEDKWYSITRCKRGGFLIKSSQS